MNEGRLGDSLHGRSIRIGRKELQQHSQPVRNGNSTIELYNDELSPAGVLKYTTTEEIDAVKRMMLLCIRVQGAAR